MQAQQEIKVYALMHLTASYIILAKYIIFMVGSMEKATTKFTKIRSLRISVLDASRFTNLFLKCNKAFIKYI